MFIKAFSLENITSYKALSTFEFNKDLNILIGPNGGGKTNALQALRLSLEINVFRKQTYNIDSDTGRKLTNGQPNNLENSVDYQRFLVKNDTSKDSEVKIIFQIEESDIRNFLLLRKNADRFNLEVNSGHWNVISNSRREHLKILNKNPLITLIIKNGQPITNELESIFLSYCHCSTLIGLFEDNELASKLSNPLLFMQAKRGSNINYSINLGSQ